MKVYVTNIITAKYNSLVQFMASTINCLTKKKRATFNQLRFFWTYLPRKANEASHILASMALDT